MSTPQQFVAFSKENICAIYDLLSIPNSSGNEEASLPYILFEWSRSESKSFVLRVAHLFQGLIKFSHRPCFHEIHFLFERAENGVRQRLTQAFYLSIEVPSADTVRRHRRCKKVRTEIYNGTRCFSCAAGYRSGPLQLNPHRVPVVPTGLLDLFGDVRERGKGDNCPNQTTQRRYPFAQAQLLRSAQSFISEHACCQQNAAQSAYSPCHDPAHPVSRNTARLFHSIAPAIFGRRLFPEYGERNDAPSPQPREVG